MLIYLYYILFFSSVKGTQPAPKHMYDLEHGTLFISYSTGFPGMNGRGIIYFDDFGNRQLIQLDAMSDMPMKNLQVDSIQYMWMDTSQCIKSRRKKKFALNNITMDSIDSNAIKAFGIKFAGVTKFLDLPCNKYNLLNKDMDLEGEILEWDRIPLMVHLMKNGRVMENIVGKIDTVSKLPSGIFELPKGIQIVDGTSLDNH